MGTSKFGGKYGSICGQILGTLSRLPMCFTSSWNSSSGDCRRMSAPVLSKDLNNYSQSKTEIRNWTKKSPLRVKPIMDIMDQKNDRTVFQVDIMSVHPPQIWHQTSLNHAQKTSPSEASEVLWEVAHCWCSGWTCVFLHFSWQMWQKLCPSDVGSTNVTRDLGFMTRFVSLPTWEDLRYMEVSINGGVPQ